MLALHTFNLDHTLGNYIFLNKACDVLFFQRRSCLFMSAECFFASKIINVI